MAENKWYNGLQKLFSTGVVVRRIGKGKIKVVDTASLQAAGGTKGSKVIDRYGRIYNSRHTINNYGRTGGRYPDTLNNRLELYTDYEAMATDSILSSALDIYSDESTVKSEQGDLLKIKSKNEDTRLILENLFYDILNIDHNLWWWIRNMVKYGDFYLSLNLNPELGIVNAQPLSSYDVVREELFDDDTNQFKVKFIYQGEGRKSELQYFEVAHFRLLTDSNFLPYGRSMLEGARKVWKSLVLMEDAMLINRIMRAPERRIIKVDIGNLKPDEVDGYMEKVMNKMRKVPYIDDSTGEINLKFNLINMMEDVFLAVRGDKSGTTIDTLPGLDWNTTEDIEYLRLRMMAALKIPKAFLGYEADIEGKCLAPNTEIAMLSGEILTIKEIADKFIEDNNTNLWCYSFDFKTNSIIPAKIKLAEKTRLNTQVVRVHIDNNTYIDCTPDHHFILRDGTEIEAQNLKKGDSLRTISRRKSNMHNTDYEQVYQDGKWIWTHKMVDEYINGELVQNTRDESGRFIQENIVVRHHKDGNRFNNTPDNLERMKIFDHAKLHSDGWQNNDGWLKMHGKRSELNKLPENRKRSSEIQKQRIKDNPELANKVRDSWMNLTPEQRSEIVKNGWYPERQKQQSEFTKKQYYDGNGERMHKAYKDKFNGQRPDLWRENSVVWVERPTIDDIIGFINNYGDDLEDINHVALLAKKMGYSHHVFEDAIKTSGWDISEFFNEYIGFRSGRSKKLRRDSIIELLSGYGSVESFMDDIGIGSRSIETYEKIIGDKLESFIGLTYNHKVVGVEWLSDKIDTYNMEVDNENHNYLLSNGIVIKNSTLSQLDVRFSRTIEMLQRIVVSELTKIAIIHLFLQGYTDSDLVEFELELTNPSIIYEQEKISLLSEKFQLVSTMQGTGIISQDKIYKEVFDMSEDEIKDEKKKILEDYKWKFRVDQIAAEGNDPAISGESYGTPHDLAAMGAEEGEAPEKPNINIPKDKNDPGQGRPKEPTHYGAQSHPSGRDPLAKKDVEQSLKPDSSPLKHNFRNSPLALQNAVNRGKKKMITELYNNFIEKGEDDNFLNESNIRNDNI